MSTSDENYARNGAEQAAFDASHRPDLADAAEHAARNIAQRYARALDVMMPHGDGRDVLLGLLAIAWLEGSKVGLTEGADLALETFASVLA